VGTTTTYGGPWGLFEFTDAELVMLRLRIAEFAALVMSHAGYDEDDVNDLLADIQAEIAREVEQQ
jgi:hypothetical protein